MFDELLRERLGVIATIEISSNQILQLKQHFDLLNRWNKVLNLTSVRKPEEIIERHYCESLFLASHLPAGTLHIADVGSGAGFPGIPIAVARPECSVALVESHQRKSVFLREASRELPNVRVIATRAEDLMERFDWAVSRAVKYLEIERSLASLADQVAILGGEEAPSSSCFTWNVPIQLPWGARRFLWLGVLRST